MLNPRAHPRSRGENQGFYQVVTAADGSSPLTRGKPVNDERAEGHGGLIPAHAGKTRLFGRRGPLSRAHPRSRGENENPPLDASNPHGSSPLTRGKRGDDIDGSGAGGLIPAHAGKTDM